MSTSPVPAPVVLRATALTKRYGRLLAVDELSLAVTAGEVFGLLGPNGAGKTTTISLLCGLLQPDSGAVLLHERPVRGGDGGLRQRVGVCPQAIVLWPMLTCLEQLVFVGELYGLRAQTARQRALALLEMLGLAEKRDQLARTLSGGMQRRLNVLLALVHDPEIVVLDEPEAGLDPQSRVLVRDTIRSLARRKTVLLTTHNMDEADRLADRVAIIDHGRLLALDTPEALKGRIGDGDVLEIRLVDGQGEAAQAVAARLGMTAAARAPGLVVRGRGLVNQLPALLTALHAAGLTAGEARLRANTLEDVFLALTGRGLRE